MAEHSSNKWAVLASGTGSLFKATIEAGIYIDQFVADRTCSALRIAQAAGIHAELIERTDFTQAGFDPVRAAFTCRVRDFLKRRGITHVAMMGFETVFSRDMFIPVVAYAGRMLNSHPSLLPAFKGLKAPHQAVAAGVKVSGCTIHVATEKLDDEETILARVEVPVPPGATGKSLWDLIKVEERILWPRVIRDVNEGRIDLW